MYEDLSNEELFGISDYSDTDDKVEELSNNLSSSNEMSEPQSSDYEVSSSSPLTENEPTIISPKPKLITLPSIIGLILYENLLTHEQQSELINGIIEANYFDNPETNQAMCFGTLPSFIHRVIEIISNTPGFFPDEIQHRDPLFDQARSIINLYRPGEGIAGHVDLPRFEDGIVVISLLSSCVMRFRPSSEVDIDNSFYENKFKDVHDAYEMIPVTLRPGSVLALNGPARYNWTHEIEETEIDEIGDKKIIRSLRISVTLRKMKKDQLLSNKDDSNPFSFEIKKR
ncbi:14195_t:CDS:2 [Funneliformis geosporum]|uniref:7042_t:CDS:1 n=1 Tax=Funneliformis geosporum TaxID=1117311 RepID=A0A9W4SWK0_9GLOM|nr:14195_t:CDS:2 [Funneliformis geosporum]CAI2183507.1 7042_t:CDS:2 [Funneliformis geosporum]